MMDVIAFDHDDAQNMYINYIYGGHKKYFYCM